DRGYTRGDCRLLQANDRAPLSPGFLLPATFLFLDINSLDPVARQKLDRGEKVSLRIDTAGRRVELRGSHQQANSQSRGFAERHFSRSRVPPFFQIMENALDTAGA